MFLPNTRLGAGFTPVPDPGLIGVLSENQHYRIQRHKSFSIKNVYIFKKDSYGRNNIRS